MQNLKNAACETEVYLLCMKHSVTYYGTNIHLACLLTLWWTEYLEVRRRI